MHLIENTYSKYKLTDEEERQGSMFSTLQLAVIQNLIADSAEQKDGLILDPTNVVRFAQQEADLKGRIAILTYLKAVSQELSAQRNEAPVVVEDEDSEHY